MLHQGKCTGNAKSMPRHVGRCALKLLETRVFKQYLKGVGASLGNAHRVLEAFSAMLTE
jgi:hypothetical protein